MSNSHSTTSAYADGTLSRKLFLLAVIAGVSAANLYYNQPLLDAFHRTFPDGGLWVGSVPAVTQLGYAVGMLLLAPLGDRFDRRRLILLQIVAICVALIVASIAPTAQVLVVASFAIGIFATIAQQAMPFAAEIAPPSQRGRAVGTVMSGLLLGILLARTAAGFIGEYFGWRAVFAVSVLVLFALSFVIVWRLPRSQPTSTLSYGRLIASMWHLVSELSALRRASLTGALLFAAFNVFWSVLALLLAGAPFYMGPQVAGMFGIIGAAGALSASYTGRYADLNGPRRAISAGIVFVVLSFVILAVSGSSLIGLVIGVVVLDAATQGAQISNQSLIYGLKPEARSRVNTVFMTCYFLGGGVGSGVGAVVWPRFGWVGVCIAGIIFASLAWLNHLRK